MRPAAGTLNTAGGEEPLRITVAMTARNPAGETWRVTGDDELSAVVELARMLEFEDLD